ncbi:MAG TPA: hypothetical protein VFN21_04790 [Acidimicrobiales bacterium]|nr:hypothetical protein [Acidimicrobiales bacterium]
MTTTESEIETMAKPFIDEATLDRFMIEHFDNIADWADWALTQVETWSDTTTPLQTHRDATAEVLLESLQLARKRT